MLTEEEKWSFDLHGFLVLKGAVSRDDVKRMVELCDTWHALEDSELPPPLRTYWDVNTKPTTPRSINNVPYADEVFQRLVLNREIMRVVLALTQNCPQLLSVALTRQHKRIRRHSFSRRFLRRHPQSSKRLSSRQWRDLCHLS